MTKIMNEVASNSYDAERYHDDNGDDDYNDDDDDDDNDKDDDDDDDDVEMVASRLCWKEHHFSGSPTPSSFSQMPPAHLHSYLTIITHICTHI